MAEHRLAFLLRYVQKLQQERAEGTASERKISNVQESFLPIVATTSSIQHQEDTMCATERELV
jgi:hypothetical protein